MYSEKRTHYFVTLAHYFVILSLSRYFDKIDHRFATLIHDFEIGNYFELGKSLFLRRCLII